MAETGHKHAHLMAAYAADALETDEPHLRWEFRYDLHPGYDWQIADYDDLVWDRLWGYRRKPDAPAVPWHLLREVVDNE